VDWSKVLESALSPTPGGAGGGVGRNDDLPPIESRLSSSQTLVEHLLWQLQMQHCTDAELEAARVIITNLDGRGYLSTMTLEQVAEEIRVELDDAEGAQMIVQSLEPLGCGSLTLEESLSVQARIHFPDDPHIVPIIQNHLCHIKKRDYRAVARAMGLALAEVIEYHRMIRELEPWPARGYSDAEPRYLTPDVHVFKTGDEWQIVMNEDGLPKLRVSGYYRRILNGTSTAKERSYIREKLNGASFFIRSIYHRQRSIYQVVECLLERQREFFDKGVEYLRPLILRDVADAIGVHESTVSRIAANKVLSCPWGLVELSFFFDAAIPTTDGKGLAGAAVRARIARLVATENRAKPLSDQALVGLLREQGIICARRTVAKYREAMAILPSGGRRRLSA